MKLSLLLLLLVCTCVHTQTINKIRFEQIANSIDYKHHIVIIHPPVLQQINHHSQWHTHSDVIFYLNDCSDNRIAECQSPLKTPLIMIFNRVPVRFNANPNKREDILKWLSRRIQKHPEEVHSLTQLEHIINITPNIYCFVANQKKRDQESAFHSLSKNFPFLNYCLIKNYPLADQLGLKQGNLTFILNSTTNRRQFIYSNRYQAWQWFIKANFLPTIGRAGALSAQRFTQSPKNISVYAVACDFSLKCEDIWTEIINLQQKLTRQILGYDFRLAIQDQKQSLGFNLYYHLTFDLQKLPAFIHIDLRSDSERAGDLIRYIQYFQTAFTLESIKAFIEKTQKREIQPFYLSAPVPKKNGFYGKSSERFIQKLVASNVQLTIANSANHYVILVTAMNIGCSQCESFYKQYKQVASLLVNKDITFGFLDATQNEVSLQYVKQLPEILLYHKEYKENPIRQSGRHNFDNLIQFLKKNLGQGYSNTDQL